MLEDLALFPEERLEFVDGNATCWDLMLDC
jgi:hypothetical protein